VLPGTSGPILSSENLHFIPNSVTLHGPGPRRRCRTRAALRASLLPPAAGRHAAPAPPVADLEAKSRRRYGFAALVDLRRARAPFTGLHHVELDPSGSGRTPVTTITSRYRGEVRRTVPRAGPPRAGRAGSWMDDRWTGRTSSHSQPTRLAPMRMPVRRKGLGRAGFGLRCHDCGPLRLPAGTPRLFSR
jgi:hypothetical protein